MKKCTEQGPPNYFIGYFIYDAPNIHSVLIILVTLPVTTATAERSSSTLQRLKTCLRNNTGEQRLTGLALMNIYQNNEINVEEVINRFARLPRKCDFLL